VISKGNSGILELIRASWKIFFKASSYSTRSENLQYKRIKHIKNLHGVYDRKKEKETPKNFLSEGSHQSNPEL